MKPKLLLIMLMGAAWSGVFAQQYRFTPNPNELYFGLGQVIYQGDLPSNSIWTVGSTKQLDVKELNQSFTLGFGHRFAKRWAFRNNLTYLSFAGADKFDDTGDKTPRNLSFRTKMFEYTPLLEFSFIHWDQQPGYLHHHLYFATGISLFYFNPQAKYDGKYYDLQPLSTEGQGFTDAELPYRRISAALPFVAGYRYRLNKQWVLGVELSLRKSFTDYLDDVSTTYYDNEVIKANKGEVAAALSDRNIKDTKMAPGSARGNPSKGDNYFYSLIQLSYFLGER